MELTTLLDKRQSIRKYKDIDIPEEDIREIVRAAGKAPSEKNHQSWHFVAIKNRALIEKIGQTIYEKNESVCEKLDMIDPEKGARQRKLCKNFWLFCVDAKVLTVVLSTAFLPENYNEYKIIEGGPAILEGLVNLRNPGLQSIGAALENFALKAVDLGYGTCWMTGANIASEEITDLLKREAGFEKEGYFMVAMMAMGVPEEGAKSPSRKKLEDIYTFIG